MGRTQATGTEEAEQRNALRAREKRKKDLAEVQVSSRDAEREDVDSQERGSKHAQWLSMFGIKVRPERPRKPEPELLRDAVEQLADVHIRDEVTMPADPDNAEQSMCRQDAQTGGWLAPVSCAFRRCTWCVAAKASSSKTAYEDDPEHPRDQQLRAHVSSAHGDAIHGLARDIVG